MSNQVNEIFSCPDCEEKEADNLLIDENENKVTCLNCGCKYYVD
jgi:transcription elongation factor Elf1